MPDPPMPKQPEPGPPAHEAPRHRNPLWLVERDQLVLYLLAVAVLAVGAARYARLQWPGVSPVRTLDASQRIDYRVDINRAGADELDLLPGIGPVKAERIVEYRQTHGPFAKVEDLARVPGISADCVARLHGLATAGTAGAHSEGPAR